MNDNEKMALAIFDDIYCDSADLKRVVWLHSRAVADMALECVRRHNLEIDADFVEQAALLHDIGVIRTHAPSILCMGDEPYICHGIIGGEMLRSYSLPDHALVAERHTGSGLTADDIRRQHLPLPQRDFIPVSDAECLICYADKFYSKSGDLTRSKSLQTVREQMARFGKDSLLRFEDLHLRFRLTDC